MLKALSVSRNNLLIAILTICLFALSACAGPAPAGVATPGAAAAPTRNLSAPVPLPSQPTSPPVTVAPAVPFATATFSSIVIGGAGAAVTAPTLAPTAVPTRAPATPTQAAGGPAAPASGRAEIKFDFVAPLGSAEFIEEVDHKMKEFPGILSVSGNELSVTIAYNPALITPDQIRQRLASVGNAVKP